MRYEWKVALRFLRHDRNQTLFILMAIALGVTVLIFLESLIVSLQASLIDDTIGASAHIVVEGKSKVAEALPDKIAKGSILGDFKKTAESVDDWLSIEKSLFSERDLINVTAVLENPAFINRGTEEQSVLFRGIQLENGSKLYRLNERLKSGTTSISGREILIGKGLAEKFDLAVGDIINVSFPSKQASQWFVRGIVDFEVKNLNDTWVIIDLPALQSAIGREDQVSRFEIQVKDVQNADQLSTQLAVRYPDLKFRSWKEDNAQLLIALRSQSSSTSTISLFVLLSILMGISSVLGISVAQKNREIGILKAMGATNISSRSIFLIQGLVLGFFGAVLGSAGGWLLINGFTYLTQSGGGLTFVIELPPHLIPNMILTVTLAGVASAWFPSNKSATLNPIEVIRNG